MKENCCPPAAAMTISTATPRKTALIKTRLYRRKNGDLLVENADKQRLKLDCWARKVRIKTPLIAPLAQVLSLFSRENGDSSNNETMQVVTHKQCTLHYLLMTSQLPELKRVNCQGEWFRHFGTSSFERC